MEFAMCVLLVMVYGVSARPDGAPTAGCETMIPGHGVSAQSGVSTITVTPSATSFDCNDTITVTLTRGGSDKFKGFLCQARPNPGTYSTTGTINVGSYGNKCSGQASVTHTERSDKTSVQFTWQPSGKAVDFQIVCTVVEQYSTFWVKVPSATITYSGTAETCGSTGHFLRASVVILMIPIFLYKLF